MTDEKLFYKLFLDISGNFYMNVSHTAKLTHFNYLYKEFGNTIIKNLIASKKHHILNRTPRFFEISKQLKRIL